MTVLVVGDANADLVAPVARFPAEGDDVTLADLQWASGGSAANVATSLALLGAQTRLLARVGSDPAAQIALQAARAAGVDLSHVQHDPAIPTGLCYTVVSPGGERTFFSFRGANTHLALPNGATTDAVWLHLGGHALLSGAQRATTLALVDQALQRGIPLSLDLCLPLVRAYRQRIHELLPHLCILFSNEHEMHEFGMPDDVPDKPVCVIKRGAAGCVIHTGAAAEPVDAFSIDARDTNGCGDAFTAGFVYAYLRGAPLAACATLANGLGALTATRHGSADALPDRATLRRFLSERLPANHAVLRML